MTVFGNERLNRNLGGMYIVYLVMATIYSVVSCADIDIAENIITSSKWLLVVMYVMGRRLHCLQREPHVAEPTDTGRTPGATVRKDNQEIQSLAPQQASSPVTIPTVIDASP